MQVSSRFSCNMKNIAAKHFSIIKNILEKTDFQLIISNISYNLKVIHYSNTVRFKGKCAVLKKNSGVTWTWDLVRHGGGCKPLLKGLPPYAPSILKYSTFSPDRFTMLEIAGKVLPMPLLLPL